MHFEGDNLERFFGAHYTTCKPDAVDWRLTVDELALDRNANVGTGYNAYVQWKGIPILYLPYMTFPLNNDRRSGFLPPTVGTSTARTRRCGSRAAVALRRHRRGPGARGRIRPRG